MSTPFKAETIEDSSARFWMTNAELVAALDRVHFLIRNTASHEATHAPLLAHFQELLRIQQARAALVGAPAAMLRAAARARSSQCS